MVELKDVTVEDYLLQKYGAIDEEEILSKALGKFSEHVEVLLVVGGGNVYKGTLSESLIIKSRLNPISTKVKSVAQKAPKLGKDDSIFKAAKLMLENDVKHLPVLDYNGQIIGVVSDESILAMAARSEISNEKASEFMKKDVTCFTEDTTIAKSLSEFRRKNFSHAPVIDKKKRVLGVVAMHDLLLRALYPMSRAKWGEKVAEKISELKAPIVDLMSHTPFTAVPSTPLKKIIQDMILKKVSAIIMVNQDNIVQGIVTKNDILKRIAKEAKSESDFVFSFAKGEELTRIDEFDLAGIKSDVTRMIEKYKPMLGTISVTVYLKRHRENVRKQHLYNLRIRISTGRGLFTAHSNGIGISGATHNALDRLKKQLEKYKEQHMRKDTKSRVGKRKLRV